MMPITDIPGSDSRIWAAFPADAMPGFVSQETEAEPIIRETGMPFFNAIPTGWLTSALPHINTNLQVDFPPDENGVGDGFYRPGPTSYWHAQTARRIHRHVLPGAIHNGVTYTAASQLHYKFDYPSAFPDDDLVRPFYGIGPEGRVRIWTPTYDGGGEPIPATLMEYYVPFTPDYTIDLDRLFKSIHARPIRAWESVKVTASGRDVLGTITKGDWFQICPLSDAQGFLSGTYAYLASNMAGSVVLVELSSSLLHPRYFNFAAEGTMAAPLLFATTGSAEINPGKSLFVDPPEDPDTVQFSFTAGTFGCQADADLFASLSDSANPFTLSRRLLVPAGIPHDIYIDTVEIEIVKKRRDHERLTFWWDGDPDYAPEPARYLESGTDSDVGDPIRIVLHVPHLFWAACET